MQLSYECYLDQIYGGWIGKSMGGAAGACFEGTKEWLDLRPEEMLPRVVPPNDDLDMSVLWLKVLEEKGMALRPEDLADAWLQLCWYPLTNLAFSAVIGGWVSQRWPPANLTTSSGKLGWDARCALKFGATFFQAPLTWQPPLPGWTGRSIMEYNRLAGK